MTDFDCEKLMDSFTDYDEKVVRGTIVQVYYFFDSVNMLKTYDVEVKAIASSFRGISTGNLAVIRNRRDLDFEFSHIELANSFRTRLKASIKFFEHKQMNMMGHLIDKPTIAQLEEKKRVLKEINCTGNIQCTR